MGVPDALPQKVNHSSGEGFYHDIQWNLAMTGTERAASRVNRTGERPLLVLGASPPQQLDKALEAR